MSVIFIRFIGISILLFSAVLVYFSVLEIRSDGMTPERLPVFCIRVGSIIVLLTSVGIGLLHLRKWSAVFASIFFTYYAARFLYEVYPMHGGPTWRVGFLLLLLITPLFVTIKFWRELKPGGRLYF
jgi:hypothetical protein